MNDQAEKWSRAAERYEEEFLTPFVDGVRNPLPDALAELAGEGTVVDLGCGTGVLLPALANQFSSVVAVDFAEGMLRRARDHCKHLTNITYLRRAFTQLDDLAGTADVAVAVNSLILPELGDLEHCLESIHAMLRPGGTFLGIVPAMDGVHYLTMLLVDRARRSGMPTPAAKKNAGMHAEHELYDFAFGDFRYRGLVQHFWQPFEIAYRLRRAGFRRIKTAKVILSWQQFGGGKDLEAEPPPWDWFFRAQRTR